VTTLVHGKAACDEAVRASEIMFGGGLDGVTEALFNDVAGEIPTKQLGRQSLEGPGMALAEALVLSGLCPSKGQARKDVEGGGIYLNNVRVAEAGRTVSSGDLLFGKFVLLRKGKRSYVLLRAE
jgi:tyrosyl-tRNA synthetase